MAASMLVGVVTVLCSQEPNPQPLPASRNIAQWLQGALVAPFADFIQRYRWQAALVLALIAVYRISDVVMGIMANPFYVDMGFSKDEVAAVTKVFGVVMTLLGAFIGGVMSMRWGVMRVLMLGAVLSAASNLLFAWLSTRGHRPDRADAGGQCQQFGRWHCLGGLYCLPLQPDECAVLGHAVRAVQLHDAAGPQVAGGLFWPVCRCLWLRNFFCVARPVWACRCCCWWRWQRGCGCAKLLKRELPALVK